MKKKKVKKVMKKTVTETIHDDGTHKTVVKESPSKVVEKKPKKKRMSARDRDELLIENFVGLQHAMTNMSIRFGSLSENIIKLLQVFEESAKNLISGDKSGDKDMLSKIDSLLVQNKTIAKGLVLMESKLRGRAESVPIPQQVPQQIPQNIPLQMSPSISEGMVSRPKPLPST